MYDTYFAVALMSMKHQTAQSLFVSARYINRNGRNPAFQPCFGGMVAAKSPIRGKNTLNGRVNDAIRGFHHIDGPLATLLNTIV